MRTKATERPPLSLKTEEFLIFSQTGGVATILVSFVKGNKVVVGGHYAPDFWANPRNRWFTDDVSLLKADRLEKHLKMLAKRGYVHPLPESLRHPFMPSVLKNEFFVFDEELKEWMVGLGIDTQRRYPQ